MPILSNIEATKIIADLLEVLSIDQLRCVVDELKALQERGHGELTLTVKNGEVWYLNAKTGKSIRKQGKEA